MNYVQRITEIQQKRKCYMRKVIWPLQERIIFHMPLITITAGYTFALNKTLPQSHE